MTDDAQKEPSAPVAAGDVLAGKYRVERVLGQGAMGVVVAAMHVHLGERVALKFLHAEMLENAEVVARFLREAQAAVRIKGEHVCRVTDVGTLDSGAPYMVMEYLEGQDLGAFLEKHGKLDVPVAVDFIIQTCDALAEAHSTGIVHRDLKPSNLFLSTRPDGSPLVKVLDFGVAKVLTKDPKQTPLTAAGAILGSPLYMSPEQIVGKPLDMRSDIWQLGVILYELLTGKAPFDGASLSEIVVAIGMRPPAPPTSLRPDIPKPLEEAILRCLEKDVAKRMPDVGAVAEALLPFAATRRAHVAVENIVTLMRGAAYAAQLPSVRHPMRSGPLLLAGASEAPIGSSPPREAAGAFAATMAAPLQASALPLAPAAAAADRLALTTPGTAQRGGGSLGSPDGSTVAVSAAAAPPAVSTMKWVLIGGVTAVLGTLLTILTLRALSPGAVPSAAASGRAVDAGGASRGGAVGAPAAPGKGER